MRGQVARLLHTPRARARDEILFGFTPLLRVSLANATRASALACARSAVRDPRAATLFSRALLSAALMSAFQKGEERAILHFSGPPNDALTSLYAEAMHIGEVRGYANGGAVEARQEAWDGRLRGSLSVSRVLYGAMTPLRSILEVTPEGDVEAEVRAFYERSEQRPAAVRLQVEVDDAHAGVVCATGVLVEALALGGGRELPADNATSLEDIRSAMRSADLCGLQRQGHSLAAIAGMLIPELSQAQVVSAAAAAPASHAPCLRRVPLDFFCRCTAEGFLEKLVKAAPSTMLDDMATQEIDGKGIAAKLRCQFCNQEHVITQEMLLKRRQLEKK
jgi:redox-regulated HSP33 family molecular chaperone